MHPLPLTGTETCKDRSKSKKRHDASPTPHGDGNLQDIAISIRKEDDASPTPHGDGNQHPPQPGITLLDASPTPHGDGNLGDYGFTLSNGLMHPLPLTGTETPILSQ